MLYLYCNLALSKVACCWIVSYGFVCVDDAETEGPDQRKDAVTARTHTPLQQGKK